jgi:prophage antirepressor-like protein
MDTFSKHYNVKVKDGMYCLNDIAVNVMKTANKKLVLSKIKEKTKLGNEYYISGERFRHMVENARSDFGKMANKKLVECQLLEKNGTKNENVELIENNNVVVKEVINAQKNNTNILNIQKDHKLENQNSEIISQNLDYENIEIHMMVINEIYWFRATHICKLLAYEQPQNGINMVLDENKSTIQNILLDKSIHWNSVIPSDTAKLKSIHPKTIYINYSGLYELCLLSKKPKALEFRKWVHNEVISSIVKTGSYTLPEGKVVPLPYLTKYEVDLNDHIAAKTVYIARVTGCLFKYGWSAEVIRRFGEHCKAYDIDKIMHVFTMKTIDECLQLEGMITTFCMQNKIKCGGDRQKELLGTKLKKVSREMFETTPDLSIEKVLEIFKSYVSDIELNRKKQMILDGHELDDIFLDNDKISDEVKIKKLESDRKKTIEIKQMEINKETEIELKKMEYEFELKKYELQYGKSINNTNDINNITGAKKTTTYINKQNTSSVESQSDVIEDDEINEEIKQTQPKQSNEKKPRKKVIKQVQEVKQIQNPPIETKEVQVVVELPKSKYGHSTKSNCKLLNGGEYVDPKKHVAKSDILCTVCKHNLNLRNNQCGWCSGLKKLQHSLREKGRPSFLTLKKEIEESSVCAVARKYLISDNGIKKWLRTYIKYGLTDN